MIVVDANAIVYALLPGQFTENARAWLKLHAELLGTPLLFEEMRHVLLTFVRRGTIDATTAISLCAVVRAQVRMVETPEDSSIIELALSRGLTGYDATHVATARQLGLKLLTGDKAILGRCGEFAVDVRAAPAPQ